MIVSNSVLVKPCKLLFKGRWFVSDCQNRESEASNENEADRLLALAIEQYKIRLALENGTAV